jgi:D-beta-D-heptose 7-phosphate kinase/D-beta-D-heptose 1-phosphate adenosyltransferase
MIVLVTGGFDPLHVGHVRMFRAAQEYGRLVVGLNSDAWLMRKKGYAFMPWEERAEILDNQGGVSLVLPFDDADDTVCALLESLRPHYFANGGDRMEPHPAEHKICQKYGIKELFEVGGEKVQSSSGLVRRRLT